MKATCPNNHKHVQFEVTAHVTQRWLTGANGEFLEEIEDGQQEVVHKPNSDDRWLCASCGAEATVTG